ncbi:MAG: type II toxin-antitoxin system RelE/ParE family toxin [Gammaproteobacteria bacterium]
MIEHFSSKTAQDIYDGIDSKSARRVPLPLHPKICRLFDRLNIIEDIQELRIPPSNRLEKLQGILQGYWSIRVNVQWRIIFRWHNNAAHDVDITDYH